MAAQQAGEAASATLPTYAHTPFPDLTGLRTSAPSRLGKASSGSANDAARNEVDLRTNIRLQDLGALEKEFDVQEGDLVRAAWGAVLVSNKDEKAALLVGQVDASGSGGVHERQRPGSRQKLRVARRRALSCESHTKACQNQMR